MSKTVIAVFRDAPSAETAVTDLMRQDLDRDHISILARDTRQDLSVDYTPDDPTAGAASGAGVGAVLGGAASLLAGLGALTLPGLGPLVAAGPLAAALTGAGSGAVAGGLTAALVNWGVPSDQAHVYDQHLSRGAVLVLLRADDTQAQRAASILARHHPIDLSAPGSTGHPSQIGTGPSASDEDHLAQGSLQEGTVYLIDELGIEEPFLDEVDEFRDLDDPSEVAYLAYEQEWHRHWQAHYAGTGRDFGHYRGAYVYGCRLYDSDVGDWPAAEPAAQRYWQQNYPRQRWEDYCDAVRQGFMVCERL